MPAVAVRTVDGGVERVDDSRFEHLREALRGELLLPGQEGYERARTVWNAMIDRRPALIARCRGAADVMRSVAFAREHELLLSIKGGGHNIAGKAVCDRGLMIDLSLMRDVTVDPEARRAWVGPGATLADLDHESQAFGLATPLGINSTTGVAGLTLGGGFGWLTRKLGLTVDNLRSAQLVTADAELVRASENENADLFWGLRGGGGNFGVVTSFELELHPLGPDVLAGLLAYPADGASERFARYRDQVAAGPDEQACWMVIRRAPPLPFIPAELHGREVQLFAFMWAGEASAGTPALDAVRAALGAPAGEHVVAHPYVAWQQAFDPLLAPGARNYWKSHYFKGFTDEAIQLVCDYGSRLPTAMTEIFIGQLGGQANRVPADATAYPHRDAEYAMNVHARWEDPEGDARAVAWAREFHAAMAPFATGGVYVNFVPEGDQVPDAAFGPNYERLAEVKSRWDARNLFRVNQNVAPRSAH